MPFLGRIPEWLQLPYLVGIWHRTPAAALGIGGIFRRRAMAHDRHLASIGLDLPFQHVLVRQLVDLQRKILAEYYWRTAADHLARDQILRRLRGGGDLWDNPRYRVVVAGLQSCLACLGVVVDSERAKIRGSGG